MTEELSPLFPICRCCGACDPYVSTPERLRKSCWWKVPIILTPLLFVCFVPFLVLSITNTSDIFVMLASYIGGMFITSAVILLVDACVFNPMCAFCPFCASDDDIERGFKHAASIETKKLKRSGCCGKRILDRIEAAQQSVLVK